MNARADIFLLSLVLTCTPQLQVVRKASQQQFAYSDLTLKQLKLQDEGLKIMIRVLGNGARGCSSTCKQANKCAYGHTQTIQQAHNQRCENM